MSCLQHFFVRSACAQSNGLKSLSRPVQGKTKANGKVYIVRCGLKEAASIYPNLRTEIAYEAGCE